MTARSWADDRHVELYRKPLHTVAGLERVIRVFRDPRREPCLDLAVLEVASGREFGRLTIFRAHVPILVAAIEASRSRRMGTVVVGELLGATLTIAVEARVTRDGAGFVRFIRSLNGEPRGKPITLDAAEIDALERGLDVLAEAP